MKYPGDYKKLAVCLLCLFVTYPAFANENVEVVTVEGSVVVSDAAGKASKPVVSKNIVPSGNLLATGANSRAVVRVGTDGFVVMGKNSKIEISKGGKDKPGFFKQLSGIVYYAINSIKGNRRAVEVRTATTTIGIRGTRFLVTENEDRNEIGMRKGIVNVASVDGDFEIHKNSSRDEFEAYKKEGEMAMAQNAREFEEYKEKTKQEFVEFKKEFSLAADHMASFDGKRVVDLPLSGETKKDMEDIESYAEEWLKKVHD